MLDIVLSVFNFKLIKEKEKLKFEYQFLSKHKLSIITCTWIKHKPI